jgi:hypothetical protein
VITKLSPRLRKTDKRDKKFAQKSKAHDTALIIGLLFIGQVVIDSARDAVAGELVSVPIRWCALLTVV